MDKLTALRVFRRVAELEGFAAAGRDLGLSNAAVSKNVRELEAALGARLINRTTRRLHLTEAGALYLDRARAILDDLGEADAAVAEFASAPRGLLRISAPMSLGLVLIAPALARFLAARPHISADLDLNDRYVDLIENGFDIAIRGGVRLDDSSLIARKLGDLDRVLCAAPSYLADGAPQKPADLVRHRCIVYSLSSTPDRWTFVRGKHSEHIDVAGPLRINNSLGVAAAARAGLGLALLPRFAAHADLESGALVQVLENWSPEPAAIYAITPRHREASLKLRLFVEHLADEFG